MSALLPDEQRVTFQNEASLPSLPVPDLTTTLRVYSKSMKACLTDEEFADFTKVLHEFKRSGEALRVHQNFLKTYCQGNSRNWLEKPWEYAAYLSPRYPMYYVNYGGSSFGPDDFVTPGFEATKHHGYDFLKIGKLIYSSASMWRSVKLETLKPQSYQGTNWSMSMFHQAFNSSQVVGESVDTMHYGFQTLHEETQTGKPVDHVSRSFVILVNGKLYLMPICDDNLNLHSPQQIADAIKEIILPDISNKPISKPGLLCYDLLDRTSAYKFLQATSQQNRDVISVINNCIAPITFDFESPKDVSEYMKFCFAGNACNRFQAKGYGLIFYKNGYVGFYSNHTPCEGVFGKFIHDHQAKQLKTDNFDTASAPSGKPVIKPLKCGLTDDEVAAITPALQAYNATYRDSVDVKCAVAKIGKVNLRSHKIHPSAFIQIAMQLAYQRSNDGKVACVYETAQLRKFYNARTETAKTCTLESVQFCKAMQDPKTSKERLIELFKSAHGSYLLMQMACTDFKGCDRHLMMLEKNSLTSHYTYKLAGGGGNYILSTSAAGSYVEENQPLFGGCVPMVADGYGTFYCYGETTFPYTVISYKASPKTDSTSHWKAIETAMFDILKVIEGSGELGLRPIDMMKHKVTEYFALWWDWVSVQKTC